jgi:hypothetical protein
VPYSAAVVVEEFDESDREGRGLTRIAARIYVERDQALIDAQTAFETGEFEGRNHRG